MPRLKAEPTDELSVEEFAQGLRDGKDKPEVELSPEEFAAGISDVYPQGSGGLRQFAAGALEGLAAIPELGLLATKRAPGAKEARQAAQGKPGAPALSEPTPPLQDPLEAVAGGLRGLSQELDPIEARGRGGLAEDLIRTAGGIAGSLPAMAAGPSVAALQFGAQSGVPLYYEIKAKTGDEEAAQYGLLFGQAVGRLEQFGAEKFAGKLIKSILGKGLSETVEQISLRAATRTAKDFALGAAEETGTELLQTALEDKIYEGLTGDDIDNAENLLRALPPSALMGGAFRSVLGAWENGRARAEAAEAQEAPTPPTEAQETVSPTAAPPATQVATPAGSQAQAVPSATPTAPAETSTPPEASAAPSAPSVPAQAEAAPTAQVSIPEPVEAQAPPEPPAEAAQGAAHIPEPSKTTGIKNATVERELEEMGLPATEPSERVSDIERHRRAMETFQADPKVGERLVDDLEANPRPPDPDEVALLAFEANRLINERDAAQAEFNKDPSEANQKRIERARDAYLRSSRVFKGSGSESGAAFRLRQMMLARDYSLAAMEASYQEAKGGENLTAKESARIKELHDQLAATQKAHAEAVTAAELAKAELQAEKAMKKLRREAQGSGRRAVRAKEIEAAKAELGATLDELGKHIEGRAASVLGALDAKTLALTAKAAAQSIKIGVKSFAQFADSMVTRFGEGIRPYLEEAWKAGGVERRKELAAPLQKGLSAGKKLTDMGQTVGKIARDFVESGITERGPLVQAVHEVLKEIDPNITLRETQDAISGYGQFRRLSRDEVSRKLRDLKGQLQQISKLEDLEARIPPSKTGFERREPSAEERRLIKQVKDLSRRLGLKVTDPATQLKSRLQSMKTRLTNRIADLQDRIARKDFGEKPKPQPIQPDTEAVKLQAEHERVRKQFESEKERERLALRSKPQKIVEGVAEFVRTVKEVLTAYDISAPFRQGIFYTLGQPIQSIRRAKLMFQAMGSERRASEIDAAIRNRPGHDRGEAAGLKLRDINGALTETEEHMRSRLGKLFPGVKMSNRGFITYLNLQAAENFDRIVASRPTTPTAAQAKVIADGVNAAVGRGTTRAKRFEQFLNASGELLWAPRLYLSRLQLLTGHPMWRSGARGAFAKDYARFIAGAGAVYGLVALYNAGADKDDEATVETDWRSSDFGRIKIHNTRIDPMGGFLQFLTLTGRLWHGETKDKETGQIKKANRLLELLRFGRYKLSPVPALVVDALAEETALGEQVTPAEEAKRTLIPMAWQDLRALLHDQGIPRGMAIQLLSLFGLGIQVHEKKKKKR